MNRAYSLIEIKAVNEDDRVIEGIASTPSPDRMGDIVEPLGAQFKLPMPLLWQHRSGEPVGNVTFAKPNKNGIPFKARIERTDEPGTLKNRLDEAWQSVKLGLVRAVSIGFTINAFEILKDGGWRINEWEWLELSLVTIPANADATITNIRSIDSELLAASGQKKNGAERTVKAGVTASRSTNAVKAMEAKTMKKTIAEQISAFEATRQAKSGRMDELMDAAAEKGETLDQAQQDEYDTLDGEVKSIDAHLVRLRAREVSNAAAATEVRGATVDEATRSRSGSDIRVRIEPKKLPAGTMFTRYVLALARTKGDLMMAERQIMGNEQWMAETPELLDIIKTAVNAGTTTDSTWAGPLVNYQIMTQEFIDYLRPRTIIGRIPGLRRVPFKIKVPRQTGAATVNWVGEGKVKPLTSMAFDSITMEFAKIAGIIPLTEELVRFSNPSAEALVREELANAIVQFMDSQFVDPTKASNDVSPASITNGVTPTTATATTAAGLRADIKTLVAGFLANNYNTAGLVWLMTQQQALAISLMQNSLGQAVFPGLTLDGGTLAGLPVVTSENIPATGGSPTDGGLIILLKAGDILLADDGQVTIDASREASLQMDTAPDSPPTASTVTVSLWQHNMIAIKAERYINWAKARTTAVAFIQNAKYAE
jgi:HK97 family phage major capsid protein/HK97 family phage prohead protease